MRRATAVLCFLAHAFDLLSSPPPVILLPNELPGGFGRYPASDRANFFSTMLMARVLITAFAPYDEWRENASWLALVRLTSELPDHPQVTTRRYPVDFDAMRQMVARDLETPYDVVLHLGQAPGSAALHLETFGLNIAGLSGERPDDFRPLSFDGPPAYRSELPLADWSRRLRAAGVPAQVSYHAGTYLCNATLYWSHHIIQQRGLATRAGFIHVPLDVSQTVSLARELPALATEVVVKGLQLILAECV
jgi:pyroglutamyl-peptidase